jgi:hypothetical protein
VKPEQDPDEFPFFEVHDGMFQTSTWKYFEFTFGTAGSVGWSRCAHAIGKRRMQNPNRREREVRRERFVVNQA